MYDVAVIGCGVIGAAAAHALAQYQCRIVILEAENDPSTVSTRANSGILHPGYDPKPGTWAAKLNPKGALMAKELCRKLDVPIRTCGSLVLALAPEELSHLRLLYDYGIANGVPNLRLLNPDEVLAMEPAVTPTVAGALYSPDTAVINPWEYTLALAETAVKNGAEFRRNAPVTDIRRDGDDWILTTPQEEIRTRFVVNAAGLGAEALHNMVAPPCFKTTPSRGEYYLLDKSEGHLVSHVIFQCPSAAGKGVLVSPTVHGNCIVGPNAEPVEGNDTSTTAAGLDYVARTARRSVPSVNLHANIRNFAGVRGNTDHPDFIIQEAAPRFIDLAGMRSPGLSSAPAVAQECIRLLKKAGFNFPGNISFDNHRRHIRFAALSPEEKNNLIQKNPAYGRVICRCETVTEGEILDALHSPIPPVSVDGIKRRTGSGLGRCQGGFCAPRIVEIMSRGLHISPLEILKDKEGSHILTASIDPNGSITE